MDLTNIDEHLSNIDELISTKPMKNPVKDVPGGFPKSDLLGVTVALIHVAAQRFLAVLIVLTPEQYNKVVLCQLQRQLALWL